MALIWYGDTYKAEMTGDGEGFEFEVYIYHGLGKGCSCRINLEDEDSVHISGLSIYHGDIQKILLKVSIDFAKAFLEQLMEDRQAEEEEMLHAYEERMDLAREANQLP
jgi:hypothetical protein